MRNTPLLLTVALALFGTSCTYHIYNQQPAPQSEQAEVAPAAQPEEPVAQEPVAQPAPAPPPDPTVYVTRTGEKFHQAGCQYLRLSQIPLKLSEARERGYGACSRCW